MAAETSREAVEKHIVNYGELPVTAKLLRALLDERDAARAASLGCSQTLSELLELIERVRSRGGGAE
jgi:hypothetical protein